MKMINEFFGRSKFGFENEIDAVEWIGIVAPGRIPTRKINEYEMVSFDVVYQLEDKSYRFSAFVGA